MIKNYKIAPVVDGALALGAIFTSTTQVAYPEKPVTVILPTKMGGAADINLRILVRHLRKYTDVKIILKNIPGSGTATQGILRRKFSDMTPIARMDVPGPTLFRQRSDKPFVKKFLSYFAKQFVGTSADN